MQTDQMTVQEAIDHIEALYPADSGYYDTRQVAITLMKQAMEETDFDWRDMPERTLIRYAELCIQKDEQEN